MTAPAILCLGESLIDRVRYGPGAAPEGAAQSEQSGQSEQTEDHVGGSLLNVACGLGALDHRVALGSWWGDDAPGRRIAAHARDHGVHIMPGSDGASRTSVAHATLDAQRQATYEFDLQWQVPDSCLPDPGAPADWGHLHIGSLGMFLSPGADRVVQIAQEYAAGATVSFDPNIRPGLIGERDEVVARVEKLAAMATVVKASAEDVEWMYGASAEPVDVLEHWTGLGADLAVLTLGEEGAMAMRNCPDLDAVVLDYMSVWQLNPIQVEVADTVGAGDSFMAGLLSGLAEIGALRHGQSMSALPTDQIHTALRRAVLASALTVSRHGAFSPTRQDLASFARDRDLGQW